MKTLLVAMLLTFATSATALSINTPVLDVKATVEACPSMMNGFGVWFSRWFTNTFPAING